MSYTPWRKHSSPHLGRRFLPFLSLLAFSLLTLVGAGCQAPAKIHPDFSTRRPARVDVAALENATIHSLDRVGFGGMLQRATTGPRFYDVEMMLHSAVVDALERRGFTVTTGLSDKAEQDFREPVDTGVAHPFDAVAYIRVDGWRANPANPGSAKLRATFELSDVPTGDSLYSNTRGFEMRERRGEAPGSFLESGLRRAALSLVAELP